MVSWIGITPWNLFVQRSRTSRLWQRDKSRGIGPEMKFVETFNILKPWSLHMRGGSVPDRFIPFRSTEVTVLRRVQAIPVQLQGFESNWFQLPRQPLESLRKSLNSKRTRPSSFKELTKMKEKEERITIAKKYILSLIFLKLDLVRTQSDLWTHLEIIFEKKYGSHEMVLVKS